MAGAGVIFFILSYWFKNRLRHILRFLSVIYILIGIPYAYYRAKHPWVLDVVNGEYGGIDLWIDNANGILTALWAFICVVLILYKIMLYIWKFTAENKSNEKIYPSGIQKEKEESGISEFFRVWIPISLIWAGLIIQVVGGVGLLWAFIAGVIGIIKGNFLDGFALIGAATVLAWPLQFLKNMTFSLSMAAAHWLSKEHQIIQGALQELDAVSNDNSCEQYSYIFFSQINEKKLCIGQANSMSELVAICKKYFMELQVFHEENKEIVSHIVGSCKNLVEYYLSTDMSKPFAEIDGNIYYIIKSKSY